MVDEFGIISLFAGIMFLFFAIFVNTENKKRVQNG